MKVKKINSSSIKTSNKIRESFAELLQEKGNVSDISVCELVKRADITRSSFYTHYDNIYDVAEELQEETLKMLSSDIKLVHTFDDVDLCIDKIFNYLEDNFKIYKMILSSNEPFIFAGRLNRCMLKEISNVLNDNSKLLSIEFFCDGSMSLIIKYFRGELNISFVEVRELIKSMAKKIIK